MNKIQQKLQQRAKFNKGKRVGYAEGRPVVDRETGEVLENFKPTPAPAPTPAPVLTARTFAPVQAPSRTSSPAPVLPEGKLKQVDSSGNILKDTLIGRQPGETAEQYRARTAGQFTPNPNQKTFKSRDEAMAAKSGLTLEEYKAQPEENVSMQTNAVARTESDQWWHPSHPSLR